MDATSIGAAQLERLLEFIRHEAFDAGELIADVCSLISAVHEAELISDSEAERLKARCAQRWEELRGVLARS